MNYIPGFSNYLQTSVPRYAIGGRVMDGERMMYDEPMMYGGYDMGGYNEMPYGGGGMLPAPVEQPYQQAAVEPMTQEAAPAEAPFDPNTFDFSGLDLSGLNNLYGMNFGSNFGGGAMGGIYPNDPNLQYIGAPLSNKGNATSQTGGNTFAVRADQPVRLVDHRTNQIVFEGTGFDAARKATELGQGLTDQFGRKANYSIQTADPTGNYSTVAYEKKNKSTLGTIASVAGTVLPLAMIPLTMGMSAPLAGLSTAGKIALGAGLGGLGSGLKGDNILKGAAMGGLSAAGGQLLGPVLGPVGNMGLKAGTAIGTGLGATAGGLATGQSLKNSLLGGVASGALSYVTPDIAKGLGIGQTPATSASTSGGGVPTSDIVVSGYAPTSIGTTLGGSPNKIQRALGQGTEAPYDGITAIGERIGNPFGVNLGGNQYGAPGEDQSAFDRLTQPEPAPEMPVEDIIKVTGQVPGAVTPYAPIAGFDGPGLSPEVINKIDQPAAETPTEEEILVQARKGFDPVSITAPLPTEFLPKSVLPQPMSTETVSPEEILVEARKPLAPTSPGLSPEVLRAVEGPVSEKPATDEIVVTGQRPGAVPAYVPIAGIETPMPDMSETPEEAEAKKKKLGLEEYLRIAGLISGLVGGGGGGSGQAGTYGGGGTGRLNPIFSAKLPSAGGLGTIGANRTARPMGDVDWLTYGTRPELNFFDYAARNNPAPITTPIPNNPAGPIMKDELSVPLARGGSPRRTEFAVNGAGTGRSDDIPAVLSDGEYVIDAETVALLGDGSNKAGAKKLDELRVKVRKHKGQKLAKGRFSANAKKAEAYLSGGRI
jgi:hypothetical protein